MVTPHTDCERALEAKKYDKDIVIYSVTFIRGSPRAVEISAMDFNVRLGNPEVQTLYNTLIEKGRRD